MVPLAHAFSQSRLKLIANEVWTEKAKSLIWKLNTLWKDQVSFPLRKKFVFSSNGSRIGFQMVLDDAKLNTVKKIQCVTEHKI